MDGELRWIYIYIYGVCLYMYKTMDGELVKSCNITCNVGDVLYVYLHVVDDTSFMHMSCLMDGENGWWTGFLYPK